MRFPHLLKKLVPLLLLIVVSCRLRYVSDRGFLNSAQANAFEFPVKINGKFCKDLDGIPGLCVKQMPYNVPLKISILERPYSYSLSIACSSGLEFSRSFDVPRGTALHFKILDYKQLKFFQCIGEIFPDDRVRDVSAKFAFYVKLSDPEYMKKEIIYNLKKRIILGKYSRYTTVCYENTPCFNLKKRTILHPKNKKVDYIITESEQMRFGFLEV